MRNRMIVVAGVFVATGLSAGAAAQETQPATVTFRSDVRMCVYVYDDEQSPARSLGRMPAPRPIEVPAGREWEVSIAAADFAAAKDALVAQLTDLGRRKCCPTVLLTEWATDADVEALAKVEGLRALAVDAGRITDKALATMATMSGLREIRLTNCTGLTAGGVAALAALPALSRLTVDACPGMANELAAKLRTFPALRRLTLSGDELDARGLGDLAATKTLTSLHLFDARWLRDGHLATIAQMTGLAELNLAGCDGLRGGGLAALAALPGLKTFATADVSVDVKDCAPVSDAWLEQLAKFPALRRLRLADCSPLTEAGLANLQQMNALEELTLAGLEKLTEPAAARIAQCTGLESLTLVQSEGVNDEALAAAGRIADLQLGECPEISDLALGALAGMGSLTALTISSADKITPAGVLKLADAPALIDLTITTCRQIGESVGSELRKKAPHLNVHVEEAQDDDPDPMPSSVAAGRF